MTFKGIIEKNGGNAWTHFIMVPEKITASFQKRKIKRLIATFNGECKTNCALIPNGKGSCFININNETRKKLNLQLGQEVLIELVEDKSKYGMPMPEEMQELLAIDDEADQLFHKLTPGKQRSLLFMIGKPKSSNKRLEKAVVITDYLKSTNGKVDFKELTNYIKEFNQSGGSLKF